MNQPNARDQIYKDIVNSFATMLEIMIEREPEHYSYEDLGINIQGTDKEEAKIILEPSCLYDSENDDFLCFWTKGHINPKEFCDAVLHFEEAVVEQKNVKHEYWRILNYGVFKAEGKGRGAFPVTTCGGW